MISNPAIEIDGNIYDITILHDTTRREPETGEVSVDLASVDIDGKVYAIAIYHYPDEQANEAIANGASIFGPAPDAVQTAYWHIARGIIAKILLDTGKFDKKWIAMVSENSASSVEQNLELYLSILVSEQLGQSVRLCKRGEKSHVICSVRA